MNRRTRICSPLHDHSATQPETGQKKRESRQFSASPFLLEYGAGNGVRTHDLNLGKVALYQLSYARVRKTILSVHGGRFKPEMTALHWRGTPVWTRLGQAARR